MARRMDPESTLLKTDQSMKVNGKETCSMDKVKKYGQMVTLTQGTSSMERNTVSVNLHGLMAIHTAVITVAIKYREKEHSIGMTGDSILADGKTTRWRAKVPTIGQTAECTPGCTKTIRRRGKD